MVRQGRCIALVGAFLIGCAVLLMAGASGVQAEASKKEEARCEGTRTIKPAWAGGVDIYTTNDLPGCPKGGLLLGTDKSDAPDDARPGLAGQDGDDTIRGLGGSDEIFDGSGDDVIYGGDGDDFLYPDEGNDVLYGGDGNDELYGNGSPPDRDKLYCGKGRDTYIAYKPDYVDSSCEVASGPPSTFSGHDVVIETSSASASPVPLPQSGGPAILLLAAALLLGSGILTYAILRRR